MNRLALSCTVLLLALTAVAFVHDRSAETAPLPAVVSSPPVVAAAAPTIAHAPTAAPTLDRANALGRIEERVLEPVRRARKNVRSFSRVMRPPMAIRVRVVSPDSAPELRFELHEELGLFSRDGREQLIALGRLDRRTGRIELATGAEKESDDARFHDLETGLRALGVAVEK